jgi:hypothetical protein
MTFDDSVVEARWSKVGEKCERCGKKLGWRDRESSTWVGTWQAYHADGDPDNDAEANCKILCWPCHKLTSPDS